MKIAIRYVFGSEILYIGEHSSIQAWIAPLYPYITYLLLRLFFQLYLNTRARAILFCAGALFINLIDVCI